MGVRPDGLVHLIRYVSNDGRGGRRIAVACGGELPTFRSQDRLSGATGWMSAVTCTSSTRGDSVHSCRDNPAPWSETPDPAAKKK